MPLDLVGESKFIHIEKESRVNVDRTIDNGVALYFGGAHQSGSEEKNSYFLFLDRGQAEEMKRLLDWALAL